MRAIRFTSDAVTLHDPRRDRELWRVPWDAIAEIVAFKVDVYIVDQICLGFRLAGSDTLHIACEGTEGWTELNAELARRFGVVYEEWFPQVAFPPFVENRTVLWTTGMPPATSSS